MAAARQDDDVGEFAGLRSHSLRVGWIRRVALRGDQQHPGLDGRGRRFGVGALKLSRSRERDDACDVALGGGGDRSGASHRGPDDDDPPGAQIEGGVDGGHHVDIHGEPCSLRVPVAAEVERDRRVPLSGE